MSRHVDRELSAWCQGDLDPETSRRVSEHVLACPRCHGRLDAVRRGVAALSDALPEPSLPEGAWAQLDAALASGRTSRLDRRRWSRAWGVAAAVLVVAAAGLAWWLAHGVQPGWRVASLEGRPLAGRDLVEDEGFLPVGRWLVTDAASRARLTIGRIGTVDVEPGSRLKLKAARLTEQRMALERGRLHARIFAPPRLFFVETPSAVAVDLGCAYTLSVDDAGNALLEVTSGRVMLELAGRESLVPEGATCLTRAGRGPGTPVFADAAPAMKEALERLDFEDGGESALTVVLAASRPRDSLTLWNLLPRIGRDRRPLVHDRLAQLVPPPEGVTRDGVLAGDEAMLARWRPHVVKTWN